MLRLPWCLLLRRKCGAHTQARTSVDCGAVKPQHNDPQLLVCRELLSAAPNKVPAPYAWDSRTLLHLLGVFYMHQSITFTYPG